MFVRLKFGGSKAPATVAENSSSTTPVNPKGGAVAAAVLAEPAPITSPQGPRIKSYRVAEVRQAMAAARRELGDDAILIQTKRIDPPEGNVKYEVTFGVTGNIPSSRVETALVKPELRSPAQEDTRDSRDRNEISLIRADLAALQAMIAGRFNASDPVFVLPGCIAQLRAQLVRHGVDPDLAAEWACVEKLTEDAKTEISASAAAKNLVDLLHSRIHVDASLASDTSRGKANLLIGPPGSGTTTALLKLALDFGVKRGRPVEVWSLDSNGGGVDPLIQSFTQFLNAPVRAFTSAVALQAALGLVDLEQSLILIDTKGFGQSVAKDAELSSVLGSEAPIDCQLVLSSAWQATTTAKAVGRYEIFRPTRLLFTMLDQSCAFGSLLQEPWRTKKPISFLGTGPLGSGTLQAANLATIVFWISESTAL